MEQNQRPYYLEFSKSETDRKLKLQQLQQQQNDEQEHQKPVIPQHSSKSNREKINRSQSQMTYRNSNGTTSNCFEVSKVYASKLMYERPDDFPCFSEAAAITGSRSARINESLGISKAEKSLIKKSKSSHLIKSSYSPKSFLDSTIGNN